MATQANPYLVITDGTDTVTIADGSGGATNYQMDALTGWAPAIAGLSQSQLGGRGPYDDVLETMRLDVTGATAAAAYLNLQTLERLIDKAQRWSRGDNVSIVLIKFAPQGSTVASTAAPLQCAVMGYAPNASAACTAGNKFMMTAVSAGSVYVIPGVQLRFMRRAAWLLAAAVTGTSASVANPGPYPITGMTTIPNISPALVALQNFDTVSYPDTSDGKPILLLAQQDSDLQIAEADAATATAYTTVADAANKARGGSVLRYTPTGTTEALSGEIALGSITAGARRFAFFAAVRNNSASVTWKIRVGALIRAKTVGPVNIINAYTRLVAIDASHVRPRYVPLGIVSVPEQLRSIQLAITASSTAAAPTLDIDYIIALAVDNPYARAIQLDKIEGSGGYSSAVAFDWTFDPRPLTGLAPLVYRAFQSTSDKDYNGFYGDSYPVASGTTFTGAIMCKRQQDLTAWVYLNVSAVVNSLVLSVSRYDARLVPE